MDAKCSLRSEVIFLSDIRMGQISNQKLNHKVSTSLIKSKLANYIFEYNSTSNKRGVAILIDKKLNPVIKDSFRDQNENILLVTVTINGGDVILGSIYGPNNTDRLFYRDLDIYLTKYAGLPVMLGGD
jgi:exonuclease III